MAHLTQQAPSSRRSFTMATGNHADVVFACLVIIIIVIKQGRSDLVDRILDSTSSSTPPVFLGAEEEEEDAVAGLGEEEWDEGLVVRG